MNAVFNDIRYALRIFRNSPTFAAVAVLSITVGVGANTAVFSWLRSLLLNPLPGATQPERIVAIENTAPDERHSRRPISTFAISATSYAWSTS